MTPSRIAAPAFAALMTMTSLGAHATECESKGQVVTKIIMVDGKPQINAYPTGFCSAWEAIGHGLAAALAKARETQTERSPPTTLAITAKQE